LSFAYHIAVSGRVFVTKLWARQQNPAPSHALRWIGGEIFGKEKVPTGAVGCGHRGHATSLRRVTTWDMTPVSTAKLCYASIRTCACIVTGKETQEILFLEPVHACLIACLRTTNRTAICLIMQVSLAEVHAIPIRFANIIAVGSDSVLPALCDTIIGSADKPAHRLVIENLQTHIIAPL
jgi:hypothetical protein